MTDDPTTQQLPDGDDVLLRGPVGEPTLRISDHVDNREQRYRQQVREVQDREIKDLLDKIERAAGERRFAKPVTPAQRALEAARGAAWMAEAKRRREEPARLAQKQEELEAWATKAMAELAARADPPAPTRFGKTLSPAAQAHEAALDAEFRARNRAAAKAVCSACKVMGDCGEHG
jgi:hypothetical protein